MKIKTKLLGVIYIYIIVLAILTLGFTYYHHSLASKSIDCILYSENKLEITSQLETAFSKLIMPANDYLIHGNEEEIYLFKDAYTDIDRIFKILEADNFTTHISGKERETISRLKNHYIVVRNHAEKIFSLPDPIGNAEGAIIMEEMDSLVDDMLKDMDEFHHNNRFNVLMEIEAIDNYFDKYMIAILSILVVTGLSSLLYGLFLTKLIISPIKRLVTHMGFVEKGDLSQRLYLKTKDEIGSLSNSFNKMIYTIQERTDFISKTSDYLENILNNTQDMVVTTDTNLRIVEFNTGAEQILGYTKEEVRGKSVEMFYLDINKKKELMKIIESEGVVKNYEAKARTKQGKDIDMSITISQLKDSSGNVIGTVDVGKDITARKKWEERLKTTLEAADAANMAKREFLANMSHEIRTPMNGVIGMANLLLDTKLTPEQREYTETIYESASYLLTIINDILDFSRIEAGKLELDNIDFNLNIAVKGAIDVFAVKTEEKKLEFSCFVDSEVPFLLRGDPGRLRQVLINLVNNAIKFTKKGEVVVSISTVKETDSHATLQFAIRDTGIGIHADHVNKLFQSFSQADTGITRKYGGTGLGLAISKQIIELMGGQISVESEEGKGSTFRFTVVLEKQPSDHQQTPFERGNIENMRILIIDEDSTSRHTLKADLDSWHCRAEEVDSVEKAMKKLQTAATDGEPFKVVLLDPCILKLDIEILGRKIKEDPQLQGVHFVILTATGKRGDAKYFQRLGFEAYLSKPLKRSMLYDCLQIITGKPASAWKDTSMQIITRHTITEDYKKRTSILVVEDNKINQKITLRILDKKLGYYADAVSNGKEAIELLKILDYDLVLMDGQMPEMDGYEATRIIRDANSAVRNHNIPIIAMTANVMKGARKKCLEAGMNDYVSKPVNVQKLADAIKRNIRDGKEHPSLPLSPPMESKSKQATQDVPEVIYSGYKDDPDLAGLIDEFITSLGEDIKTMRRELKHGNYDGLRRLAHQMKGAGGSYGYPEMTEAAKKLEDAAKAKDVDAGKLALGKLTALCQAATRGRKSNETL